MDSKAPGRYSVGIKRREKIVDAATRLFAADGYHRTSMLSVAEAAGITEGGLAHYFPSKSHLLQAVAAQRLVESAAWWESLPEQVSGLAVLDETVEAARRFVAQPGLIELFILSTAEAADPSKPAHAELATRYEVAVQSLAGRLQVGVQNREIRSDVDLLAVARECIAVSDGLQLQWVLSDGAVDLVAGIAVHVARLKDAIRA